MVTSDFRPEVEIRLFRSCAMKNTQCDPYLCPNRRNSCVWCIRKCLQTELSTELYEAKNLVLNMLNRTLGDWNLNIFWQYFTISILVVLNSFIKSDL